MARKAVLAKGDEVVSLKVTLRDAEPPIWRRILARPDMTLADLHHAIQAAMGWEGSHLYVFRVRDADYGDPSLLEGEADDDAEFTLADVLKAGVSRFRYLYDFGDDWHHIVDVEKTLPAEPGKLYPACIAGKRACPPEDCGGIWGYEELLATLADPASASERPEWFGRDFDPEAFSVESADRRLASLLARR